MDQKIAEKSGSLSLGCIISSINDRQVEYQLVEISHHSIGFTAMADLEPGMTVSFLPKPNGPAYTLLIVSSEHLGETNLQKFRAISRTTQLDFESLCEDAIIQHRETTTVVSEEWNVRNIRFVTDPPLDVDVGTFGSGRSFHLQTANISGSGLLLVSEHKQKLPFNIGTLVEIAVRPSNFYDIQPIKGVGRVARHTGLEFDAKRQYVGTTFFDRDPESDKRWNELLAKIEVAFAVR